MTMHSRPVVLRAMLASVLGLSMLPVFGCQQPPAAVTPREPPLAASESPSAAPTFEAPRLPPNACGADHEPVQVSQGQWMCKPIGAATPQASSEPRYPVPSTDFGSYTTSSAAREGSAQDDQTRLSANLDEVDGHLTALEQTKQQWGDAEIQRMTHLWALLMTADKAAVAGSPLRPRIDAAFQRVAGLDKRLKRAVDARKQRQARQAAEEERFRRSPEGRRAACQEECVSYGSLCGNMCREKAIDKATCTAACLAAGQSCIVSCN